MPFEMLRSEIVYQGRAFDVRKVQLRLPDGQVTQLDIVDHRSSVVLVPVDAEGRIWFVRQYRYATGDEILELPAGVMEAGEEPEITARREIREEIGMAARKLQSLGAFFLAPGYSTEYMHVFLAENLHADALQPDEGEIIRIEKVTIEQAFLFAEEGQIKDAKSLAALFLARPYFAHRR